MKSGASNELSSVKFIGHGAESLVMSFFFFLSQSLDFLFFYFFLF